MDKIACPLCGREGAIPFYRDRRREYCRCRQCQLVFVPPSFYLSAVDEKAEYDLHENTVEDSGYRRFLQRALSPLLPKLRPGMTGLDFGCGPAPALQAMLCEQGFDVSVYDVFYAPESAALARTYDFITATEVVEHLHDPASELERLWRQLRSGGWLLLMTKRVLDVEAFASWHYKNDPTHVCFFSEATFAWLANRWCATLEIAGADVVLLGKA
ncbi:class I SAM-dependent methyltransferase [Gilvimarinus sp. SDUM040014]|uniref:Class I SAM-dependent methyltransferase n=1 Tax=Gilvimarinus algae TaxID=3058037 RepID=A0ABT8TIK2_9GAMM|nr:class I SAM-dependent methyltransferase [Gilvimarinus sp. SDUM040014]MDO3383926.1 class I SAM-dependent methyltransferase [Gilvimarinus sp. SDUM040014]